MLTQERLKEVLDYCPKTGIFTWKARRYGKAPVGSRAGHIKTEHHGKSYRFVRVDTKEYLEHRLAFLWMTGAFPTLEVDHDDGNGINNKWDNLKEVSHQQNLKNQRRSVKNSTGFMGVYFLQKDRKYRAQIRVSGKLHDLGRFTNIEDAIAARKKAEAEYGFHANHGTDRPL